MSASHVFGALARGAVRSAAGRRLAVSLLGTLALAVLASVPATAPSGAHVATAPVASPSWLSRFNTWRASTGVGSLTENTTWDQGDVLHSTYMVKNNLVTHYETPGVPLYTVAGDTAAQNGNIQVSSTTSTTDDQAIDWWMAAPFHAMNMMDPRLTQTGFGAYRDTTTSPWQSGFTLDTIRGNSFSGGQYPVYFPGDATTEPLTTYGGGEFPDPLQACPGYSAPTGLPVFIEVGGNVTTTAGPVHSFTGNGVALNHCVIDSSNSTAAPYLYTRGGVILVPQQPLQSGVRYVVALTVNGVPYTWSFTVGNFITSVTPCTSAGLTADKASPQTPGTVITFTATSTACPNPQYLYYVQSPVTGWAIARGYGGPSWAWNTATLATGNYTVDVWVRDAGSGVAEQAFQLMSFTLATSSACASPGLTSDRASPQQVDFTITFTATSAGCSNPEYLFYLQSPGGGWSISRGYGGPTWAWNTSTVASIGPFTVDVWVRQAGSGVPEQSFVLMPYTLTNRVCSNAGLTADKPSPQAHGAVITFTGTSAGCARPEYLFYVKGPGVNGTWSVAQGYGGNAWAWPTAGVASIGTYSVDVWVRAAGSGAAYQTFLVMSYTLT